MYFLSPELSKLQAQPGAGVRIQSLEVFKLLVTEYGVRLGGLGGLENSPHPELMDSLCGFQA